MIVICDTTPINYLIQIDLIDLIPGLFGSAYLPQAVLLELQHPKAPSAVKSWAASLPSWISVLPSQLVESPRLLGLHTGERQALAIAEKLHANFVLTDDYDARQVARERGINTLTTLLLLDAAADRGWLNFHDALLLLLTTNFRVDRFTIDELIEKHA